MNMNNGDESGLGRLLARLDGNTRSRRGSKERRRAVATLGMINLFSSPILLVS
jgi:hypothetical protein